MYSNISVKMNCQISSCKRTQDKIAHLFVGICVVLGCVWKHRRASDGRSHGMEGVAAAEVVVAAAAAAA